MDTIYRVIMSFESQGNLGTAMQGIGQHAQTASSHVHGLKELGKTVGETFVSMGEKVGESLSHIADKTMEITKHLLEVGGAAGAAVAAYGFHINAELEQTKLSIGSMFAAHGLAGGFEDGLAKANDQLQKMKQDVKTLPGDLGQLSSVMRMITTPAAAGGAGADQIRQMAGRAMLLGMGIHGLNSELVAREMGMILQGHAGGRNVLGQLMFTRQEAHKLQGMTQEERVAEVSKKLEKLAGPAADAFGKTWMAQWTTLKDNVKYSMLGEATQPLFERVKGSVASLNQYIEEHQEKIREVADLVGTKLALGWDRVEGIVKRIAPVIERIGDKMLSMGAKDWAHMAGMAGAGMLGTKMAGVGIEAGSGMLGTLLKLAPLLSGGGGGAFLEGLGLLANPVTMIAAGAAAAALGVAITAVAGAFDILTDTTNALHERALSAWESIGSNGTRALEHLGEAASHAWDAVKPLADTLGMALLDSLAGGIEAFAKLAAGIDNATAAIMRSPWYSVMFPGAVAGKFDSEVGKAYGAAIGAQIMTQQRLMELPGRGTGVREAKAGMGGGGGGTHIQKVEIVVKGSDDPSRVARLTLKQIQDLQRHPKVSRYVPDYSKP